MKMMIAIKMKIAMKMMTMMIMMKMMIMMIMKINDMPELLAIIIQLPRPITASAKTLRDQ
jgi:hypothetical protein